MLAAGPSARRGEGLAWDSGRQRVVLFGGVGSSGALADTWEWTGSIWLQRATSGPPNRSVPAIAYDPHRARTVLFGGFVTPSTYRADTWEWDGATWIQSPASGPSARSDAAMAYDPVSQRLILFGGGDASAPSGETWAYDGAWMLLPISGPTARRAARAATDTARHRIVLFGGQASSVAFGDTWEFDGAAWANVLAPGPSPRFSHSLAYDPLRQRTVLTEGSGASGVWTSDTWEWDGASWILAASAAPISSSIHAVIDQTSWRTVMLFGGYRPPQGAGSTNNETWEWNGNVWRRLLPATLPAPRAYPALAYDTARGRTVLLGGVPDPFSTSALSDTWEWDSASWTQRAVAGPSARSTALAYHAGIGKTVLFGGVSNAGTRLNDTWTWDGTSWMHLLIPGPSARSGHAMAYDPDRGRVVLFGGFDGATRYADTWEFDGDSWIQAASTGPSARIIASMGYDRGRRVIVLHGGQDGSGFLRDTWEWSGTAWTRSIVSGPIEYDSGGLGFDPTRSRMLFISGTSGTGTGTPMQTMFYGADIAPRIEIQPQPLSIRASEDAIFSIAAAGSAALAYQWRRDLMTLADGPSPSGSVISGSATAHLSITSAQAADAGMYDCLVTDSCGSETSDAVTLSVQSACYANCDGSTVPPLLNVNDFVCFQNRFAAGDSYANCDGGTTPPVLNVNDFVCFQNRFAGGCP